jgi:hypothetical protein
LILHNYQTRCDQCSRMTFRPHVVADRALCRRCCPSCLMAGRAVRRAS